MLAQQLVRSFINMLKEDGYFVTISSALEDWVALMNAAPKISVINPTFDPRVSDLSAQNSFWLRVTDQTDTPVACIANRLFVTDDYVEVIRSWRLWYDRGLTAIRPLNIVLPDDLPFIDGRIGHHGGLWVHPDHRKRGLSFVLPRLTRALSLVRFRPDWHCGMVFAALGDSRLPLANYGYPHMVPCIEGYFPVTDRPERVYMTYISQEEMLDQTRGDLDLLELHPDKKAVDVMAIARQRQDQPAIPARRVVHERPDVLVPRHAGVLHG